MKLTTAIEILHEMLHQIPPLLGPEDKLAVKLGIETMEAWKELRGTGSLMSPLLLPGETQDD